MNELDQWFYERAGFHLTDFLMRKLKPHFIQGKLIILENRPPEYPNGITVNIVVKEKDKYIGICDL